LHLHIVTLTQQLVRDELAGLRRLAIDRRAASAQLPRVRCSALLREASVRTRLAAASMATDKPREKEAT
jgi:hypothetical protein